jgi:hypothetical protein
MNNYSETSLGGSSSDVGKQIRESKEISPSDQFARRPPAFWVIIGALIFVNLWYDYYHPLGILFDVFIVGGLIVAYSRRLWDIRHSKTSQRPRK